MQRSLALLFTAALGACAAEDDVLGRIDVLLVGQAPSGTTYRLRDAALTIDGPGDPLVFRTEDDPDRAMITARVPGGPYTLSLAPLSIATSGHRL